MNAEIIAIGSELTCGSRLDTNSQWLSSEMEALGWKVVLHTAVSDDRKLMVSLFRDAMLRSRIVIITGGLGPTLDDITREAVAEAAQQDLVVDESSLQHIESMFQSRGREMPERNHVQALRPEFGRSIFNAHGTAPGILLEQHNPDCQVIVLPGVPAEMKRMFHEQVVSELPDNQTFVHRRMLRTFGYGESDAERMLGDLTARDRNPEVGITASQAVISLSVTARASSQQVCESMVDATSQQIRQRLGDAVYATGNVELHEVVCKQIVSQKLRISIIESSTTGGLICGWLTETETVAACLNECRFLPNSADFAPNFQQTAMKIARQMLQKKVTDFVLVSGPQQVTSHGNIAKKSGFVGLVSETEHQFQDVTMTGDLSIFRNRAARHAINLLRLKLLSKEA